MDTIVLKPGTGSFGPVCTYQLLLKNEICITLKVSHEVLNTAWGCVDLGPKKTQWTTPADDMAPKSSQTLKTLHSTSSNGDSVPVLRVLQTLNLILKGIAKFTLIREHKIGPLSSSSPVYQPRWVASYSLLFKSGLKPMSCIHLYMVVPEVLPPAAPDCSLWIPPRIFELVLFHNPLQAAVILIACSLHSAISFNSFASLVMCLDTELFEQPVSLSMTFCVLPSLCKVSVAVF